MLRGGYVPIVSGFVELTKNGYDVRTVQSLDGIAMSKVPSGHKKALSFRAVEVALINAPVLQVQHGSVEVTSPIKEEIAEAVQITPLELVVFRAAEQSVDDPVQQGMDILNSLSQGGNRGNYALYPTGPHSAADRGHARATFSRGRGWGAPAVENRLWPSLSDRLWPNRLWPKLRF